MRTTVRLDDHSLKDAKQLAARTGRTLTAVIEDVLREALKRRDKRPKRAPVKLPTFRGKGLRPGVDLDDTAFLLDIADAPRQMPRVGSPRTGGRGSTEIMRPLKERARQVGSRWRH